MKNFILLFCLFAAQLTSAQISTDRPTQSYSPFTIPKAKFQLESGFVSERPVSNVDVYNVTYMNSLVRFGVIDGFELRLTQNYQGIRTFGSGDNGWSATSIGTKVQLLDEEDVRPQISLIGTYSFANGSGSFDALRSVSDIRVLFRNTLSDRVTLDYNFGTYWDGDVTTGIYTLCVGFSATERLGLFLEPYGFFTKNIPIDHRFNTGFTYLISDNFQVDGSVGNGLVARAPDYFVAFGIGILF